MAGCCCCKKEKDDDFLFSGPNGNSDSGLSLERMGPRKGKRQVVTEPLLRARDYAEVNYHFPKSRFSISDYKVTYGNLDDYKIQWDKQIGEGSYGTVYKAVRIKTKESVVVKSMKADKNDKQRLQSEVKMLSLLRGGPNIVKLLDVVRMGHTSMIVFEYVNNPPASKALKAMKPRAARMYLYGLLQALHHTHSQGIIHLDVKPNNVLYDPRTRDLRLIDWGFATFYFPRTKFARWPGTRYTKSPELFLHYPLYDYSADMWAFGCVLGGLIFQRSPLLKCEKLEDKDEHNKAQMIAMVRFLGVDDYAAFLAKYGKRMALRDMYSPSFFREAGCRRERVDWNVLVSEENEQLATPEARDLLDRLLVYDHEARLTAREALQHPYFRGVRSRSSYSTSSRSRSPPPPPPPPPPPAAEEEVQATKSDSSDLSASGTEQFVPSAATGPVGSYGKLELSHAKSKPSPKGSPKPPRVPKRTGGFSRSRGRGRSLLVDDEDDEETGLRGDDARDDERGRTLGEEVSVYTSSMPPPSIPPKRAHAKGT